MSYANYWLASPFHSRIGEPAIAKPMLGVGKILSKKKKNTSAAFPIFSFPTFLFSIKK